MSNPRGSCSTQQRIEFEIEHVYIVLCGKVEKFLKSNIYIMGGRQSVLTSDDIEDFANLTFFSKQEVLQ